MSGVEVRAIELPREVPRFVKSWWPIYANDPHWVPPLMMERKQFFDPAKNPYFRKADVRCFVAERDGVVVGTIAATVDHRQQEIEAGVGFFGFFEFVNEEGVARALLEAALAWLGEKGMRVAMGPYNLSSNHEFGLLIDGFDTDPCIANPHNSSYFEAIYDGIGLQKAMDWYAYWVDKGPLPTTVNMISERFLKRHPQLTMRKMDMAHFQREVELFYDIYNDAWENNWGHVHLDKDEFQFQAEGLKQVLNPDLAWFAYMGDDLAGAAITLPDFNQVAKKMNGSIFPFGWWHYLTGRRRIDALRVFVLGIKQKYQHLPLGAPLYIKTWEEGLKLPIRGAECSLIVENNHRMRGALEKLGGRIYKTYRVYQIDVPGAAARLEPAASPQAATSPEAAPTG